jgi:hypothetical protein
MVTRAEHDFFVNEAAPYSRKSSLPVCLCMMPPEVSPAELEALKSSCREIFIQSLDNQVFPRRRPVASPANVTEIRSWNSINVSAGTRLSSLGMMQRHRDPQGIFYACESLTHEFCFARILGWVTAVLNTKTEEEYNFYTRVQSSPVSVANFVMVSNFLDEIRSAIAGGGPSPLLDLNCLEAHLLRTSFTRMGHLIPEVRICEDPPCADCDLGRIIKSRREIKIPMPIPITMGAIGEKSGVKPILKQKSGVRSVDRRKDWDVVMLLQEKSYLRALSAASEHLSKFPEDSEMYLHRAFCLLNLEQYADAVLDCSKSLSLKKTDKALRMRSALWWKLGDFKLAKKDLKAMEDEIWAANFLKNVAKRGMIGAIKSVS